jgi:hypothetical protein
MMITVFFVTQFLFGSLGWGQVHPTPGQVSVAIGVFFGMCLRDMMLGTFTHE